MIGKTISHYRILEKLGEGGMGVVYKARDTHLDRFVAFKILPPERVADPDRKRRFVQEAKAASALNHPNIVTIYDIDETDGVHFIAMEYVQGKTLDQLIPRHGLRLNEALKTSVQMADALAAAHAVGIVHRDFKPANVMVSENGLVKILDFGLAKLTEQTESSKPEAKTLQPGSDSQTEEGTILGTVSYMSPEQAEGKKLDARSDIFSFGSVLYEMTAGQRVFQGDSKMSTLAAILNKDPKPIRQLVPATPHDLEKIINRCLRKDPSRRFQAMPDLRVALEELKEESDSGKLTPVEPVGESVRRRWLTLGLAATLLLVVAGLGWFWRTSKPGKMTQHPLTRLTTNGVSFSPTISPDGKLLAYLSSADGPNPDIWIQQIGGGKAIQVTHEKEGASSPVFSPDGTQIVYAARGGIYEVPALGGDARLITNDGIEPFYSANGSTIVFLRVSQNTYGLFSVPRMGGTIVPIHPEVSIGGSPVISPDGSRVLSLATRAGHQSRDQRLWWIIPLSSGSLQEVVPPPLLAGENRAPAPSAWTGLDRDPSRQWIIFVRSIGDTQNLFRVAITNEGLVTSEPEQLTFATGLATSPSISGNGRMVFGSSTGSTNLWSIPIDTNQARVTGERQRLTQVEGIRDDAPSTSRDGKKVAFFSDNRLVIKDLTTGQETQLVQDFPINRGSSPRISPDGSFVAYYLQNEPTQVPDVEVIATAGGTPRRVCQSCGLPGGFSSNGDRLLTENYGSGLSRISLVEMATGRMTHVLSDPQRQLWNPFYSWDDKWVSFLMQTGADQDHYRIYVTPIENFIPAGSDHWVQLTTGEYHDDKQQFSPDGNTMYFTSNRDGFTCLWALRLDPKTKRPMGVPFAIEHFHGTQRMYSGISESNHMEVNVTRDRIITNLDEFHSDIWMVGLDPGK